MDSKCAFLTPFFGPLPPYFEVWAKTCEANAKNFHWYLYNDKCPTLTQVNPAVTLVPYQLQEMVNDFKNILGITLPPDAPIRKTCEYRILFYFLRNGREPLDQYDFIGFSDVDMIYGKLADFMPDNMQKYAFVSATDNRGCGPFTLMKRSALHVIPESHYVRNAMDAPRYVGIDEEVEFVNLFKGHGEIQCSAMPLQPMRAPGMRYRRSYAIWDHGSLTVGDSKGNLLPGGFYHFSRHKDRTLFSIDRVNQLGDRWSLSQIGVHRLESIWDRIKLKAWHLVY